MAGCRQPAMRAEPCGSCSCPSASLHHPRRSIGTRRTCAGMEVPLPRRPRPRMLQGEAERFKRFDACASPCERRKQNAPGREPEGVRVASGDRGDRSPRAGSVDGMREIFGHGVQSRRTQAGIALFRRCIRHAGDEAIRVHDVTREMERLKCRSPARSEGRGDYARHYGIASVFLIIFPIRH